MPQAYSCGQLVAASERCPLRFDLDHAWTPCRVVPEAGPRPLLGLCDQAALDRIAVDIAEHVGAGIVATDVAVVVTRLPKLHSRSAQLARGDLFDGFEKLSNEDGRRLVHQQMNMLRHQDVSVDSCLMSGTGRLQHGLDRIPGPVRFKQSKPVKTTEGDEVKGFGPVEAPQTAWHGSVLVRERY